MMGAKTGESFLLHTDPARSPDLPHAKQKTDVCTKCYLWVKIAQNCMD